MLVGEQRVFALDTFGWRAGSRARAREGGLAGETCARSAGVRAPPAARVRVRGCQVGSAARDGAFKSSCGLK